VQMPHSNQGAGENTSAFFIAISFLILNLVEKTKTRRTISPGINSGLSPRPFAVLIEGEKYLYFGASPDVPFIG